MCHQFCQDSKHFFQATYYYQQLVHKIDKNLANTLRP